MINSVTSVVSPPLQSPYNFLHFLFDILSRISYNSRHPMGTEHMYGWWLPIRASTYAASLDRQFNIFHAAMLLIFVCWGSYFAYCLVRYRAKPGVPAEYSHKGILASLVPDGIILAFELFMIFVIGLPVWAHVMEKFPEEKQANVVQVVAQQFAWNIHYPGPDGVFGRRDIHLISSGNPIGLDESDPAAKDDFVSINQFHTTIGKPTLVYLTSMDVIHSFNVPAFRTKQDVTPGMRVRIWFEPTMLGRFDIACAQLCGLGHYRMRGEVIVQTQEEFDTWCKQQEARKSES